MNEHAHVAQGRLRWQSRAHPEIVAGHTRHVSETSVALGFPAGDKSKLASPSPFDRLFAQA